MSQTYKLKNGEISFDDEKIIIRDDAKRYYRYRLFSSTLWTFFGIMSILRYVNTGDEFLLWSGLFIGIGHFVVLVLTLFQSVKSEVDRREILSLDLKQRFGNKFLDIKLVGNKIRRVSHIEPIYEELEQYIKTNFDTK